MRAYGLGNYDHFIDTRGHFFEADDIVISILVACLIKKKSGYPVNSFSKCLIIYHKRRLFLSEYWIEYHKACRRCISPQTWLPFAHRGFSNEPTFKLILIQLLT